MSGCGCRLGNHEHGTRAMYVSNYHKCHCELCAAANAASKRERDTRYRTGNRDRLRVMQAGYRANNPRTKREHSLDCDCTRCVAAYVCNEVEHFRSLGMPPAWIEEKLGLPTGLLGGRTDGAHCGAPTKVMFGLIVPCRQPVSWESDRCRSHRKTVAA